MGYHIHHAIVVTCFEDQMLLEAHIKANEIFKNNLVSDIVKGVMNGYQSFFIAPDGSKEMWADSIAHDQMRNQFEAWLKETNNFCEWVEVAFGGDEPKQNTQIVEYGNYEEKE